MSRNLVILETIYVVPLPFSFTELEVKGSLNILCSVEFRFGKDMERLYITH